MTTTTTTAAAASPSTPTGRVTARRLLSDTLVITWRNLMRNVRLPQLLLFSTVQPVMFLLLFNYVFGGAIQGAVPGNLDYLQFLLPGLMIQIATFGAGQTAMGLTEDLSNGVIDRFRALPMARSAVLAGRTLADLLRNAAVLSLMLVVAFLMGFRYETSLLSFLAGFGIALLFAYALSWVMATIGLKVGNPEAAQSAVFLPVFPLVFASSVFLPTQTMPGWLQAFANNQPISAAANAARGLMVGDTVLLPGQSLGGQVLASLAWSLGIAAVFSVLAVRTYRRAVV